MFNQKGSHTDQAQGWQMSKTKRISILPPTTMLETVQELLKGHLEPDQAPSKLLLRLLALDRNKMARHDNIEEQRSECIKWIDSELVLLRNPYNRAGNRDPRQLTLFDAGFILDDTRKVKDDPLGLINKRAVLKVIRKDILATYGNDTGDPK